MKRKPIKIFEFLEEVPESFVFYGPPDLRCKGCIYLGKGDAAFMHCWVFEKTRVGCVHHATASAAITKAQTMYFRAPGTRIGNQ